MKKEYPSLLDFLKELMVNDLWESSWRSGERIYYIESLEGADGLYDEEKTVWCDGKEEKSSANENELA